MIDITMKEGLELFEKIANLVIQEDLELLKELAKR